MSDKKKILKGDEKKRSETIGKFTTGMCHGDDKYTRGSDFALRLPIMESDVEKRKHEIFAMCRKAFTPKDYKQLIKFYNEQLMNPLDDHCESIVGNKSLMKISLKNDGGVT